MLLINCWIASTVLTPLLKKCVSWHLAHIIGQTIPLGKCRVKIVLRCISMHMVDCPAAQNIKEKNAYSWYFNGASCTGNVSALQMHVNQLPGKLENWISQAGYFKLKCTCQLTPISACWCGAAWVHGGIQSLRAIYNKTSARHACLLFAKPAQFDRCQYSEMLENSATHNSQSQNGLDQPIWHLQKF